MPDPRAAPPDAAPAGTPVPCRALALRLTPGTDLRAGLEAAVRRRHLPAAALGASVGSLARVRLRLAGAGAVLERDGPFELVALSGTLGPDGAHLHAAVADAAGAVVGGHVLEGCVVHTTAELVLLLPGGLVFERVRDPATGYRELRIRHEKTPADDGPAAG